MCKFVGVEFLKVGKINFFYNKNNIDIKNGSLVVVRSMHGEELARVVKLCDEVQNFDDYEQIVLRVANEKDMRAFDKNASDCALEFKNVQNEIYKCGIDSKLSFLFYTLDRRKLVVQMVAEERVDFRALLKVLGERYKCKIDIKLIGSRDEIKRCGSCGPCGRECCCTLHLRDFDKISIKMAKNQGLSLIQNKISGTCGKLKCCLGYENELYEELLKSMPKINSIVKTPEGEGSVVFNDLFNQKCVVKILKDDNKYKTFEFEVKDIEFSAR